MIRLFWAQRGARAVTRAVWVLIVGFLVLFVSAVLTALYAALLFHPLTTSWGKALLPTDSRLLDALLGGMLAAGATLILACIAWKQLGGIAETASADFIVKLKRDFFTDETRILIQLLDNDWLTFVSAARSSGHERDDYFVVEEAAILNSALHDTIKSRLMQPLVYSTYDLDDLVLGHFEDVGLLLQKRVLRLEMVYEEFSPYLGITWENREIQKYIGQERLATSDTYDKFEYAYQRCQRFERAKGIKRANA